MLKKLFITLSIIILMLGAYAGYCIHYNRETIARSQTYLVQIENQLYEYIQNTPDYRDHLIGNLTINLPRRLTFFNAPVTTVVVTKASKSNKVFILAVLSPDYLKILPYTESRRAPYIQMQYYIEDSGKINKSCYSNLAKIYLPNDCYPIK